MTQNILRYVIGMSRKRKISLRREKLGRSRSSQAVCTDSADVAEAVCARSRDYSTGTGYFWPRTTVFGILVCLFHATKMKRFLANGQTICHFLLGVHQAQQLTADVSGLQRVATRVCAMTLRDCIQCLQSPEPRSTLHRFLLKTSTEGRKTCSAVSLRRAHDRSRDTERPREPDKRPARQQHGI
jgi:hypothetical protein